MERERERERYYCILRLEALSIYSMHISNSRIARDTHILEGVGEVLQGVRNKFTNIT